MASEMISQLERSIRDKAGKDATVQFHKDWEQMHKGGWPVSTDQVWTTEDANTFKALGEKYLKHRIIPKAEEKAVREFMVSYEQQVHQFPSLVEETAEEMVREQ